MSVSKWEKHPAPFPHCLWLGLHHHYTASCCFLPMLLTHQLLVPVLTFPLPEISYTKSIHLTSVDPSSPAQMSSQLWSLSWMISSKNFITPNVSFIWYPLMFALHYDYLYPHLISSMLSAASGQGQPLHILLSGLRFGMWKALDQSLLIK